MFYNCSVKHFGNGEVQYNFYKEPVFVGDKSSSSPKKTYECNPWYDPYNDDFNDVPEEPYLVVEEDKEEVVLTDEQLAFNAERSRKNSMSRTVRMINDYSRSNDWQFFVTLTFGSSIDRYDFDACRKSLTSYLKSMKRKYPDFYYLCIPELHKDGAFHFHALFSNLPSSEYTSVKVKGRVKYSLSSYTVGFSDIQVVKNTKAVSRYISKYITKDLCDFTSRHRYIISKGVDLPLVQHFLFSMLRVLELKKELLPLSDYVTSYSSEYYPQIVDSFYTSFVHIDETDLHGYYLC